MLWVEDRRENDFALSALVQLQKCPLCGSGDIRTLYPSYDFRVSRAWFDICSCRSCGYVFTNPRPPEEDAAAFYNTGYYAYQPQKPVSPVAPPAPERGAGPGERILDIGCGSGGWLLGQRRPGRELYGVEISAHAVEAARGQGLDVRLGTLEAARFPDGFFDLVRLNHVLEHVYDPRRTLLEIRRILKDDGRCEFEIPNFQSFESARYKGAWNALDVPRHISHFTAPVLERLIRECGLRLRAMHFVWFPAGIAQAAGYLRHEFTTWRRLCLEMRANRSFPGRAFVPVAAGGRLAAGFAVYWWRRLTGKAKPPERHAIAVTLGKSS